MCIHAEKSQPISIMFFDRYVYICLGLLCVYVCVFFVNPRGTVVARVYVCVCVGETEEKSTPKQIGLALVEFMEKKLYKEFVYFSVCCITIILIALDFLRSFEIKELLDNR